MSLLRASTALVLVLSLLATGCARLHDPADRTLRVLVGINTEHAAEQRAWFKDTARRLKEKTGYDIEYRTYASPAEEQRQLQSAVVSGSGPDVFTLGTTFVPVAYATGAFHELTPADWEKLGGKDRYVQKQLATSGPSEDRQIGIPFTMRPFVMAYNTELYRKAGIDRPPRTWTEFVSTAKKLNDPEKGIYGTATSPSDSFDQWKYIWTGTMQNGGRLISDDARTARLNTPQVLDATTFWLDWVDKLDITDPRAVSWVGADSLSAFSSGKAAMAPMVTPTAIPQLDESKVKGKYAFAPMPTVPYGKEKRPAGGLPAATIVSGDDLAIAEYSAKKDVALEYVKMVTSPEAQLRYWKTFGDLPTDASALAKSAKLDKRSAAFAEAQRMAAPTAFTGAWGTLQIALGQVVAQTLPSVASGRYRRAEVAARLEQVNSQLQASLDQQAKAEAKAKEQP